jgi:hypothetical protein
MRLGKLLSVGEVTDGTEAAEEAGQEPVAEPARPARAAALSRDDHREVPAAAQPSR